MGSHTHSGPGAFTPEFAIQITPTMDVFGMGYMSIYSTSNDAYTLFNVAQLYISSLLLYRSTERIRHFLFLLTTDKGRVNRERER